MRLTNIPPPMALHELTLEGNIIDVAVTIDFEGIKSIMIAVLHHAGCSLFDWPLVSMREKPPTLKWAMSPRPNGKLPGSMYLQVALTGKMTIERRILVLSNDVEASMLWAVGTDGVPLGEVLSYGTAIEGMVTNANCSLSQTYLVIDGNANLGWEDLKKDIAEFKERSNIELAIAGFTIASIDAIYCGGASRENSHGLPLVKGTIFSLSENGSLFANETRLVRNCTSFLVTPAHLIFTTSQHLLKFVHMMNSPEGTSLISSCPARTASWLTISCRIGDTSRYA